MSRAKKAAANIADIAAVAGAVLVPSIAASPGVNREVSFADMAAAITGIARRRVASMATTASAVTGHKVISVTSHVTNIARTASVRMAMVPAPNALIAIVPTAIVPTTIAPTTIALVASARMATVLTATAPMAIAPRAIVPTAIVRRASRRVRNGVAAVLAVEAAVVAAEAALPS